MKMDELISLAEKNVDIKGIGFYTLGAERKNLDDEDKEDTIPLLLLSWWRLLIMWFLWINLFIENAEVSCNDVKSIS